jgi:hypothetical protein
MNIVKPQPANYEGQSKSLRLLTARITDSCYCAAPPCRELALLSVGTEKGGRKELTVRSDLPPKETPNPFGPVPFRTVTLFIRCLAVAGRRHAECRPSGDPSCSRRFSTDSGLGDLQRIAVRPALWALSWVLVVCSLLGCGGSSPTLPNVTITISPSVATLGLAGQQQFTATTSGTTNASVTWEVNGVSGGNSTIGTISSTGLYKPPAAVPNPPTVTVTVVSQANTADIANAAVTLTSDVLVSVSPASANLQLGKTQQFTASATGTTNNAVTWQAGGVTGGNSSVGTISSAGLYTAPSTYSGTLPATVSVTAISTVDTTKSASAGVTLHANMTVVVSPNPASVETFGSFQFAAAVQGNSNQNVTWEVNGVPGGSSITGTISSSGSYTAPHAVPTASGTKGPVRTTVLVTAVSQADATVSGSVIVTVFPPNQNQQNAPVPLGVSGGNASDSSTPTSTMCCGGTLGALVSRGGNQYILGNSHVLARDDAASIGESIIQPGLIDSSCSTATATSVANLSQFVNLENPSPGKPLVDAALAQVVSGKVDTLGTILELGGTTSGSLPVDGPPHAGSGVSLAALLDSTQHNGLVAKSGRSTGLTCTAEPASIETLFLTASVQFQKGCGSGTTFSATFTDLLDIHDSSFAAEGDSGSLIVTEDTADPVALLLASSDTDTLGNSISDVLGALADPTTGEQPVFVGTANTHPVAACSLPGPRAAAVRAAASLPSLREKPSSEQWQRATETRDLRASELLSRPGVRALGTGSSLDHPAEGAILLFVEKGSAGSNFPAQVDGVRTRILEGENFPEHRVLSVEESAALEESVPPASDLSALPVLEIVRARAVHAKYASALMGLTGVQGVGITASADSPGEAALMIFLVRGVSHEPISPVIDGMRTRVRESSRFRAGLGYRAASQACTPQVKARSSVSQPKQQTRLNDKHVQ